TAAGAEGDRLAGGGREAPPGLSTRAGCAVAGTGAGRQVVGHARRVAQVIAAAKHRQSVGAGIVRLHAAGGGGPACRRATNIAHESEGEAAAGVVRLEGTWQVRRHVTPPSACSIGGVAITGTIGTGEHRGRRARSVEDEELVITRLGAE